MINELEVKRLCNKYKIKYKIFKETNTILLETPLDNWLIKILDRKIKPICILHQNRFKNQNKYHIQRYVTNIYQAIDVVSNHKGVLKKIYSLPTTYKYNKKINKKGQTYCN